MHPDTQCPSCGQEITDPMNPALVERSIRNQVGGFDNFIDHYRGAAVRRLTYNGFPIEVVDTKHTFDGVDSYGELPQGTTFDAYIILKVGDRYGNRHYKKEGTGDSYGDVNWDGPFKEVQPKTKTVTVYEYE